MSRSGPVLAYAELEIAVHRTQTEGYEVELRFSDPESEAEVPPERGASTLDPSHALTLRTDPEAYGDYLAEALFQAANVRTLYVQARTVAESSERALRLRILIDASAAELQALRWELLRDPESSAPLATSEKTLFSRFMVSRDWRPVKLRAKAELRALVAVAAPANIADYGLAEVDLPGEVSRARESMEGIRLTVIGEEQPVTPQLLVEKLRAGVDVLYLACHGAIHRKTREPILYLQRDDGTTGPTRGAELAEQLAELVEPPRLVVLASCESGGHEEGTDAEGKPAAQSSLAPRLAEAGVPAVVAMQGKITMATVEQAMPVFFQELLQDGQIDRALAVARARVRDRADAWMPALYLRLKNGRIWYEPGFTGEGDEFKKWSSLVHNIKLGEFVPIVGPELGEHLRGTSRELAELLADEHGFPLAPADRGDLAKVTQVLSVQESPRFARDAILKGWRRQIRRYNPDVDLEKVDFKNLFKELVDQRWKNESEPYRILAELEGPVYISATPDPILPLCLAQAGAKPKPLFCEWRKTRDSHPQEPPYEGHPTPKEPVVHFALGFVAKPETMVLTEDDFLDYLIAAADYKLIPRVVRGTLVKSSLLFLGFDIDDWSFRVLFRLMMSLDGSTQLSDYAHVGVQIDPSGAELADVERAREYLQAYFGTGRDTPPIDIYWGSSADFLRELKQHFDAAADESVVQIDDDESEDDWVSF